ncbi:hypothetical protein [Nonomuraea insulae]|uniref:Uncharacterized protein n=1 Tax=Nonomuraea insulae TaxID=1616787 RepID=A0ABW1CDL5_9ACTN
MVGQVAVGILGDSDTILVARPPMELSQRTPELEILTIPLPVSEHALIERLEIRTTTLYGLTDDRKPILAVLRLAQNSRYAAQIRRYDPEAVADRMRENGGDFTEALEHTRAVPEHTGVITQRQLREADRAEAVQRAAKLRTRTYESIEELTKAICVYPLLCVCPRDVNEEGEPS